jgi:hypothetical protein
MAWQQQHWDNNDRKHNFNVTRQQYNDNNDDNDDNDDKTAQQESKYQQ